MKNLKFIALSITGALALASCQQPTTTTTTTPAVNKAPVAVFTAATNKLVATVVDASSDPDGIADIASYSWSWGDNSAASTGKDPGTHAYTAAGSYIISLTVTDKAGLTSKAVQTVTVADVIVTPPVTDLRPTVTVGGVGKTQTTASVDFSVTALPGTTLVSCKLDGNGTSSSVPLSGNNYAGTLALSGLNASTSYVLTLTCTSKDAAGKTYDAVSIRNVTTDAIVIPPTAQGPTEFKFGATTYTVGVMESTENKYYQSPRIPVLADGNDPVNVVSYVINSGMSGFGTYAKGTVKFSIDANSIARTGVAIDHVEYKLMSVPNGNAIEYIDDTTSGGNFTSAFYDTGTLHSELEGKPLSLIAVVHWKDGYKESFSRVLTIDHTAPQAPDVEVQGAPVEDYSNSSTAPAVNTNFEDMWVRGTAYNYISNADLRDLPALELNGAVAVTQPSSLESVSYYYVPYTDTLGIPASINMAVGDTAKVAAVRKAAINTSVTTDGKFMVNSLNRESRGSVDQAYRTSIGSGFNNTAYAAPLDYTSKPLGTNPVQDFKLDAEKDWKYVVVGISRDHLGNSRLSTSFKVVSFDNVGPKLVTGGVLDVSPLPFVAQPSYVSDQARIDKMKMVDFTGHDKVTADSEEPVPPYLGVGFNIGASAVVHFGTLSFPLFNTVNGSVKIEITPRDFDSNLMADGKYNLTLGDVSTGIATDVLGNPALPLKGSPATTVDNTDPSLNWTSPTLNQNFNAWETVNIQTTPSDTTSGVYATSLFWNDYIPNNFPGFPGGVGVAFDRTRANGFVGGPVEISRGLASNNGVNGGGLSNGSNARWNALFPGYTGNKLGPVESMALNALVVDRAGNATLGRTQINVRKPTPTNPSDAVKIPGMGFFDVRKFNTVPSYHEMTVDRAGIATVASTGSNNGRVNGAGFNPIETILDERFGQWTADLKVAGTQANSSAMISPEGVNFYRQLGTANWSRIKLWQMATDPSINRDLSLKTARYANWLISDQDAGNTLGIFVNYYPNSGSTPLLADAKLVADSLDYTYANGNTFGLGTATVAPWFKFDNTVTSNEVHKVTSNFDSVYNAPTITKPILTDPESIGHYQFNSANGSTADFTQGHIRFYDPAKKLPSTTAVGVVVGDTLGLYNFTFENLGVTYGLPGALKRVDGQETSDPSYSDK
jgi:hypothetical protein